MASIYDLMVEKAKQKPLTPKRKIWVTFFEEYTTTHEIGEDFATWLLRVKNIDYDKVRE